MCSCSNDDTDNVKREVTFSAPSDLVIYPGYERAVVSWGVESDPDIHSCVIYYGDSSVEVELTDSVMSYEITNLPEGELTVTVASADKYGNESLSTAVSSVEIYGEEYAASLSPREITSLTYLDSGASIEWGVAAEDCTRVLLSYIADDGEEFSVNVAPDRETTVYSNAVSGEEFSYITYYAPENGLDELGVDSEGNLSFPAYTLPTPEDVSAVAGWNRAVVTYTIPKNPNIERVVFYDGTTEVYAKDVVVNTTFYDLTQELELEDGSHTLYVAFSDSEGGSLSELATAGSVRVYDENYDLDGAVTRTLILSDFSAADATVVEGALTLYFEEIEGCEQTQVYYNGEMIGEVIAEEMSLKLENMQAATEYSYATLYYPYEGALDPIPAEIITDFIPGAELRKFDDEGNSTFGAMFLKGDVATLNYGTDDGLLYLMSRMWDDSKISTFVHTGSFSTDANGEKYGTATFDIGATMKITHFKLYPRSNYYFRHNMPKYFKVWGAKEVTEAMKSAGTTTTPSFDGWTLIGDDEDSYFYDTQTSMYYGYTPSGEETATTEDSSEVASVGQTFNVDLDLGEFRYLRIQVFETWGATSAFQIGEICIQGVVSEEATSYDLYDYRDYLQLIIFQ